MKTILRFFTVAVCIAAFSLSSQAQSAQKIGYLDFNSLLQQMPGIDTVRTSLEKYQESLTGQLDQMRLEFENKYLDYQTNQASMSGIIKENKEKELTDLQTRIDAFQAKAQQDLQEKQQSLLEPVISKAKQAVGDVAREMKYTLVINSIEDVVLFSEPSDNLMLQVKKKLGIE